MRFINLNCPSCGGRYDGEIKAGIMTCEYCGAKFALDADELEAFGLNKSALPDVAAEEEDDSSYEEPEPMFDFVRDACDEFLDKVGDGEFRCTPKILRGLGIQDYEEVFLIHDDTLFKSGKNGFAITDYGLYCRELTESDVHFTAWGDLAEYEKPEIDDSYIKVHNKPVAYYTSGNDVLDEILSLIKKLRKHARNFDWS